jgi:pyruvate carboxylase subunit B
MGFQASESRYRHLHGDKPSRNPLVSNPGPASLRSDATFGESTAGIAARVRGDARKIIRVLVEKGQTVAYDQSLVVLKAMKMQNEIRAPKSGIIQEVAVDIGATVNIGDLLVVLES